MTSPFRLVEKYFEPFVIVSMLTIVIAMVFGDVIARFAFSTSIAPANEIARLAFVYMIYFGVSYAIRERRHMRVTLLLDKVSSGARRVLLAIAEAIFLVYSVVVCWLGIVITGNALERGQILSATEWPTAVLYAAIIFSGAISAARLIHSLYKILVLGDTTLAAQMDV